MSLAKLEKKLGRVKTEEESTSLMESIDAIREEMALLDVVVKQEISADNQRMFSLEKLVMKLYEALGKSEENCRSMEGKCSELETELEESETECDTLEQQLEELKNTHVIELANFNESRMQDMQVQSDLRAELSRSEAMCESSNNACRKLENDLIREQERCDAMMQQMIKPEIETETPEIPAPLGWNIDVQRDGADKAMRYILTPKE